MRQKKAKMKKLPTWCRRQKYANINGDVNYFNQSWLDFSGLVLKNYGFDTIRLHPDEMEEFQTCFKNAAATLTP
jgi:hypothetical protein